MTWVSSRPCHEKACAKRFSTKTSTVTEGSKIGYQDWIIAIFLLTKSLKGVSSVKLHRDLRISQKSVSFLTHRVQMAFYPDDTLFSGSAEVDETYVGGNCGNMSNSKRKALTDTGRGPVRKAIVVGTKDRIAKQVVAKANGDHRRRDGRQASQI